MYIIVGLGNDEPKYEHTYHNVGFMTIDKLAKKYGLTFSKTKYHAHVAEGLIEGNKVVLLKPTTYMNLSGVAVSEAVNKLKIPYENLIVLYDDIDLPAGSIRYRKEGSAGTHNGMRNIISMLGVTTFPRVRVGIGRKENMDLADFVLSKISNDDYVHINQAMDEAVETVVKILNKEV